MSANNDFRLIGFCPEVPKVIQTEKSTYRQMTLEVDGFANREGKMSCYAFPVRIDTFTRGANAEFVGKVLSVSGVLMTYKRGNYDNIYLKADDIRIIGKDYKGAQVYQDKTTEANTDSIQIDDSDLPF